MTPCFTYTTLPQRYHSAVQCGQVDLPLDLNHLYRHPAWNFLRQVRQARRGSWPLVGCRML